MPRLVITLNDDGKLNIEGPLDNKMLCYGLLGLAQEAISKRQQSQSPIIRPTAVPLPPPPTP